MKEFKFRNIVLSKTVTVSELIEILGKYSGDLPIMLKWHGYRSTLKGDLISEKRNIVLGESFDSLEIDCSNLGD